MSRQVEEAQQLDKQEGLMPRRIDPGTWTEIRDRVTVLVDQGVPTAEAVTRVSTERGGYPASGTIMNRLRNGWKSPSETPSTSDAAELYELRDQLQRTMDAITKRDEIIEKRDREIERLRRELGEALQRAAHAEGAKGILRELAEPQIKEIRKGLGR